MTGASARLASSGQRIGRTVIAVQRIRIAFFRTAAVVVHSGPAIRAIHETGQGICLTQRIRSLPALQRSLCQLPYVLRHDGLVRVLEDHPVLRGIHVTVILEEPLAGTEVDRVSHVFLMGEDSRHGRAVPIMGAGCIRIILAHSAAML